MDRHVDRVDRQMDIWAPIVRQTDVADEGYEEWARHIIVPSGLRNRLIHSTYG